MKASSKSYLAKVACVYGFLFSQLALHVSCIGNVNTLTKPEEVAEPASSGYVFRQSLPGYMAEMGQCMDDVYRFWDDAFMRDIAMDRVDYMLEIHDSCLVIFQDYLAGRDDPDLASESKRFEEYLKQSRKLTLALRVALARGDEIEIKEALDKLDKNRRDAHSVFG